MEMAHSETGTAEVGDVETIELPFRLDDLKADDPETVTCSACGHRWLLRTERPTQCPRCRTRDWDRPIRPTYNFKCFRCDYEWISLLKEGPKKCPKCAGSRWYLPAREMYPHKCGMCGHEWMGFSKDGPRRCANCRSRVWNK